MATLTSSPAPHSELAARLNDDSETRLDEHILAIRAEIAKLRSQKQKLSKSLLGSARVHKYSQVSRTKPSSAESTNADIEQTTTETENHAEIQQRLEEALVNHEHTDDVRLHRFTHGVTAFPWTDTANERRNADSTQPLMLGVRIDLHPTTTELLQHTSEQVNETKADYGDSSANEAPSSYIVLLRKLQHDQWTCLKVHWTNIPKHIDTERYEHKYLPLPEAFAQDFEGRENHEESFQDDSGIDVTQDLEGANITLPQATSSVSGNITGNGQDLHKFVRAVRNDLQSWWYRRHAVMYLRQELGFVHSRSQTTNSSTKYGIVNLETTTHDARELKISWRDGIIGLLKIGNDGIVERVVVYRPDLVANQAEEDGSELSELASDDDRNVFRPQSTRQHAAKRRTGAVRMPEIERTLSRTEDGTPVRILALLQRLPLVDTSTM